MLAPAAPGAAVHKAVCGETAALFRRLAAPCPRGELPPEVTDRDLAALVLDEVLEIEVDGTFVCGVAAAEPLGRSGDPEDRLATLSLDALRYAAALPLAGEDELAARIYMWGRLPVSAHALRRWPDAAAVAEYLGLAPSGEQGRLLEQSYAVRDDGPAYPWSRWQHRDRRSPFDGTRAVHKLYVSPMPAAAPATVAAVVDTLRAVPCTDFKVANGAFGLARPDKVVCYFTEREELMRFAAALGERIGDPPAHGVPFTAALRGDGLLSWGVDPPGNKSWREWVARALAVGIAGARRTGASGDAVWRYALERVALAGVDTRTWTPAPELFATAA